MKLQRFRMAASLMMMILGLAIFFRGMQNSIQRGLGWQGMMMSTVLGALVFALGLARWRYMRQR